MRVLLDNTSLSNFALLGQADLLQQAFGTLAATTTQVLIGFSNEFVNHWHSWSVDFVSQG